MHEILVNIGRRQRTHKYKRGDLHATQSSAVGRYRKTTAKVPTGIFRKSIPKGELQ
jgi:hypothetical protein